MSEESVSLEIQVPTDSIERGARSLDGLAAAAEKAGAAAKGIEDSTASAGKGVESLAGSSVKASAGLSGTAKGMVDAAKSAGDLAREQMKAAGSIDDYIAKLKLQVATQGRAASFAQEYKLQLQGATAAQLDAVRTNQRLIDSYEGAARATDRIKIGLLALGTAAVAAAAGAFAGVGHITEQIGRYKDLADVTGDTAEAIAGLQRTSDVSGKSLDSVAQFSRKLTDALSKTDDQSKLAGRALAAIGIDFDKFKAAAPVAQLEQLAKALDEFKDGPGKTAALDSLVKGGAQLLPFFNDLNDAGERQIRLTQAQIELGDEYSKASARTKSDIGALLQVIVVESLPAYNDLTKAARDTIAAIAGLGGESTKLKGNRGIQDFAENAVDTLAFVVDAADAVGRVFRTVGTYLGGAAAQAAALAKGELQQAIQIGKDLKVDVDGILDKQFFSDRIAGIRALRKEAAGVSPAAAAAKPEIDRSTLAAPSSAIAAAARDALEAQIEELKRSLQIREQLTKGYIDHETALYHLGAQSEIDLIDKVAAADLVSLQQNRNALTEQLRLEAQKTNSQKGQAAIQGQIDIQDLKIQQRGTKYLDDIAIANQKVAQAVTARSLAAGLEAAADEEQLRVLTLQSQALGLTAEQYSVLAKAQAEQRAAELDSIANYTAIIDGENGVASALERRADVIRKTAALTLNNDALRDLDRYLDPTKAQDFGTALADSFGHAGTALDKLSKSLGDYAAKQAQFDKERAEAANITDPGKRAQAEAAITDAANRAQLQSYAQLADAAKGFFSENSRGYKTLEGVERAFTVLQLALSAQRAASAAIEAVLNQAKGDPYSAFARMAAMAAIVGALGFVVGGGFSNSTASVDPAKIQATQGTGTVFGDSAAKSDSIANSLKSLEDATKLDLPIQSGMLRALRSIDSGISGLANLLIRTVGLTSGVNIPGVTTGKIGQSNGLSTQVSLLTPDLTLVSITDKIAQQLPVIGGIFSKFAALIGGTTTNKITDSGLTIGGKLSDLIKGIGVGNFANVTTHTSGLFGGDDDNNVFGGQLEDASIKRQFGLVFSGIVSALEYAADAIGEKGKDFTDKLQNFVVTGLDRISLNGLTGTALTDAISNALSKASDEIAEAALPGLEDFQMVGEGYLETLTRVASGVESAGEALQKFGIQAISFTDVVDKQSADVAAEIIRQSIVNAETFSVDASGNPSRSVIPGNNNPGVHVADEVTGVGQIIESLSGSADDIVQVYQALLDLRGSLKSVGTDTDSLTRAMIRGAGGIDQLQSGLDAYLKGFFSQAEQTAAATARLTDKFGLLGLALPDSNAAFRQLVEGIDTSTDAGQQLYGSVLNLASAFAELHPLADQAASAVDLTAQKRAQEIQIMQLSGDAIGALAAQRSDELANLAATTDDTVVANQKLIYSLQDAADAAAKAAADQSIGTGILRQIYQLQGNTAALRADELSGLSETNQALQQRLYGLQDEAAAAALAAQAAQQLADAAAQAAAALADQAKNLNEQIFQLENAGNTAALRQHELDALDSSLQPLQARIYALQDEAAASALASQAAQQLADAAAQAAQAIADKAKDLNEQIFQLENAGNTAVLRQHDLDALDATLQPLQAHIFALQDEAAAADLATQAAKALADQSKDLNEQIFQLQNAGNTQALRQHTLDGLDPSLQGLQQEIFDLQDAAAAADALKSLQSALEGLTNSILDEVDKIRAAIGGSSDSSLASLQAQFATKTAQARAGDQVAAGALPDLAEALLKAASDRASSQQDLARIQAATAASLEQTASIIGASNGFDAAAIHAGSTAASPITTTTPVQQPAVSPVFYSSTPSTAQQSNPSTPSGGSDNTELIQTLREEMESLRTEIRTGNLGVIPHVRRSATILQKWDDDGLPNDFLEVEVNGE